MNSINFQHTGGFPLETETLDGMQQATKMLQAFGELAGDKTILQGCVKTGLNVANGYIFWNKELLEFRGGAEQATVKLVEEIQQAEFEDGENKDVYITRYVTFGVGVTQADWSDFKRVYPLTSALYIDKVDQFAGDLASLPSGWFLCDGQNNTIDLRGRFIVGYDSTTPDYDAIGKVGGSKEVILLDGQMPKHDHDGNAAFPAHSHDIHVKRGVMADSPHDNSGGKGEGSRRTMDDVLDDTAKTEGAAGFNVALTTDEAGNDQPHENRPPFYTLAYIQFKGI